MTGEPVSAASCAAVTVSVTDTPAVTVGAEKPPVTPDGSPLTPSAISSEKPADPIAETVYVVELPWMTVPAGGTMLSVKSFEGTTSNRSGPPAIVVPPDVVRETWQSCAPGGIVDLMLVADSDVAIIDWPPHESWRAAAPPQSRLAPVMVTSVPTVPISGVTPVIAGDGQHVQSGAQRPTQSLSSAPSHCSDGWLTAPSPQVGVPIGVEVGTDVGMDVGGTVSVDVGGCLKLGVDVGVEVGVSEFVGVELCV